MSHQLPAENVVEIINKLWDCFGVDYPIIEFATADDKKIVSDKKVKICKTICSLESNPKNLLSYFCLVPIS